MNAPATVFDAPYYRSGMAARAQGFPLSVNPHCIGTAAHARWAAAWHRENDRIAVELHDVRRHPDGRATLWL
jgi:hypothetical protein